MTRRLEWCLHGESLIEPFYLCVGNWPNNRRVVHLPRDGKRREFKLTNSRHFWTSDEKRFSFVTVYRTRTAGEVELNE